MNGFEKIILGLIKDFNKKDLEYAIERNISLAKLILTYEPHLITFARLAYPFLKNDGHLINYRTVTSWLKEVRPDLYEVIVTSRKAQIWLEKQINEVKKLILEGAVL